MTFTCAHTRCSGYPRKSPRRLLCSNRQSHAIPVTARRWLGPRSACYRLLQDDRSTDSRAVRAKGLNYAVRALEVAGDDPTVLANAADALSYFGEDIGATMALVDRALALNPNYARGWHVSGVLRLRAGQPEIAIQHGEAALRLSPRARVGSTFFVLGQAYFI